MEKKKWKVGISYCCSLQLCFFPVFFWAFIDSKYSPVPGPRFTFFIAKSFLFGVIAYIVLAILIVMSAAIVLFCAFLIGYNLLPAYGITIQYLTTSGEYVSTVFVGITIVLTMILTPIVAKVWFAYKDDKRLLNFFAGSSGVKSSGGIDVWTSIFRADAPNYRVKVIDFRNKRVYVGVLDEYSLSERARELFLEFVYIYTFVNNPEENEEFYVYRDYVYVDLREGNICVEFIVNQNQTNGV